jgi:hypothetical protein
MIPAPLSRIAAPMKEILEEDNKERKNQPQRLVSLLC